MQLTCRLSSLDYLLIRLPVLATSVRSRSARPSPAHPLSAQSLALMYCIHPRARARSFHEAWRSNAVESTGEDF